VKFPALFLLVIEAFKSTLALMAFEFDNAALALGDWIRAEFMDMLFIYLDISSPLPNPGAIYCSA